MQPLVIVIILLSLIGIYINLGNSSELIMPELSEKILDFKDEYKDLSPDKVADKIMEEMQKEPDFDSIGNSNLIGDGLEPGKQIINLQVDSGTAPNTRPYKFTTTTKREIGQYGLVKNNLSYKNNFPYDEKYLSEIESKDTLRSRVDTMVRNPKAHAFRSQIVLPQDESQFKENYKFTNRAIAIVRNQVSNQNKNLSDLKKVNSEEISSRSSKNIYRVIPGEIEIKSTPDFNSIQAAKDHSMLHSKLRNHNEASHFINAMKTNYNFK